MSRRLTSRVATTFGGRRGTARLALLVAAFGVLAGLTLGHGVAAQAAKSGYEQAWLADGQRGQVVQVDPVRGKANVRLQVAGPNADLDVQQTDGQLVIVDHRTGKVTSIDLGTLLAGGSRATTAGGNIKVLLAGTRMYLADLDNGTVQAVDPRTEANIGTPWSADGPLIDVGVDGRHQVWALDQDQRLTTLVWHGTTLQPVHTRMLTGTGAGSVIIGHAAGVTVVGAQGTIARVGTGHDGTLRSGQVGGRLAAPQSSPSNLVPVADPSNGSVVIIGSGGAVSSPTTSLGCAQPGGPLVFDGDVYVPCLGAGIVLVLDSNGNQVRSPIHTPGGGDPQLTVSGGHLIVSAPGSSVATVLDDGGSSRTIQTVDPKTPVQNPQHDNQPTDPPSPPPANEGVPPVHDGGGHGGHHGNPDNGNDGNGNNGNGNGGEGSGTATASARADGTVLVTWSGDDADGGYRVTGSGATVLASVPAGATSATVTTLNPGTTTTLTVHAVDRHGREIWSATTAPVTVGGQGGQGPAVSGIKVTAARGSNGVTLTVGWHPAPVTGAVTYDVTGTAVAKSGGTATVAPSTGVTGTTATLTADCSGSCTGTVSVTPRTSLGAGSPTTTSWAVGGGSDPGTPAPTGAPAPAPTTAAPAPPADTPTPTPTPAQPVALPGAGEAMVTAKATPGNASLGNDATVTLTVTAPDDWKSWTDGTCSILDTDVDTGVQVPCDATAWSYEFDYEATGSHTFQVRATAHDGRIADSAGATVAVRYIDNGCDGVTPWIGGSIPTRRLCDGDPMCGQVYCFAATRSTQLFAAADPDRRVTRLTLTATSHDTGSGGWPLVGWLAVVLGGAGVAGAVALRRRRS